MAEIDEAISHAWGTAGSELDIRSTTPFIVNVDGNEIVTEAFLPDFGSPRGTVVLSGLTAAHYEALKRLNYFTSILFPTYRVYTREHFVDTLNDWQWFGPQEKRPSWYTGKPWS
jgi:hypothetical protein